MLKKIKLFYNKIPQGIKASIWFTVCSIIQKGIQLITVPFFTRILTAEQYGQYSLYQSWLSIISIFATLNLSSGVFNNGMLKYKEERTKYISSMQGLSTIVSLLVIGVYISCKNMWNKIIGLPDIVIVAMLIEIFFTPAFQFWSMKQRYLFKYKALVIITLVIAVFNPVVGLIAVSNTSQKGIARILSVVVVNVFVGLFFYIYNFIKGKTFYYKEYWKFALLFNLPLIPHYLSMVVLSQADRIMIEKMFGQEKIAIYSVAYSVSMVMNIIVTSINSSYVPWTYQKIENGQYKEFRKMSNILLFIVGIITLIPMLMAPEIISIMAPNSYSGAIWVIPPVALSVYFIFLYSLFGNIEFYFEESYFVKIASVLGAVLNIILNMIFMPIFGYIAAGYTTLICYMIFAIAHYLFMKKVCKKHINGKRLYDIKNIIINIVILLFISGIIMLLYSFVLIRYIIILLTIIIAVAKRQYIMNILRQIRNK